MAAGPALLAEFEAACAAFQLPASRPRAEAYLTAFRASAGAVGRAKYVLDNSRVPFAQFHAANAIRDAALRGWAAASTAERASLRTALLEYVVATTLPRYVAQQLLQTVAILYKRGWLDAEQASAAPGGGPAPPGSDVLSQAQQMLCGPWANKRLGLELLTHVVTEFGTATCTAVGAPVEFHSATQASFEASPRGLLRCIFLPAALLNDLLNAQGPAGVAAALAAEGDRGRGRGKNDGPLPLLQPLLSLLSSCLEWRYTGTDRGRLGSAGGAGDDEPGAAGSAFVALLHPPRKQFTQWRQLLLGTIPALQVADLATGFARPGAHLHTSAASGLAASLLALYATIRQAVGADIARAAAAPGAKLRPSQLRLSLLHGTRQALAQLAAVSVRGGLLSGPEVALSAARAALCRALFGGVLGILASPLAPVAPSKAGTFYATAQRLHLGADMAELAGAEVLGMADVIRRLAVNFGLASLADVDRLLPPAPGLTSSSSSSSSATPWTRSAITELASVTSNLLRAAAEVAEASANDGRLVLDPAGQGPGGGGGGELRLGMDTLEALGTWHIEAFDLLQDSWAAFVHSFASGSAGSSASIGGGLDSGTQARLRPLLQEQTAGVFRDSVVSRVRIAKASLATLMRHERAGAERRRRAGTQRTASSGAAATATATARAGSARDWAAYKLGADGEDDNDEGGFDQGGRDGAMGGAALDDSGGFVAEQLECAACLARFAPHAALPFLTQALQRCCVALQQHLQPILSAPAPGSSAAARAQQTRTLLRCEAVQQTCVELRWILVFAARVLCDPDAGSERPMVPPELVAKLSSAGGMSVSAAGGDPVDALLALGRAVLQLVEFEIHVTGHIAPSDGAGAAGLFLPSGLAAELFLFLRRWAGTYLLLDLDLYDDGDGGFGSGDRTGTRAAPLSPKLVLAWGLRSAGGSIAILRRLVHFASLALALRAHDGRVAVAAVGLLTGLASRPGTCAALPRTPEWCALLQARHGTSTGGTAGASGLAGLARLARAPAKLHRHLVAALVRGSSPAAAAAAGGEGGQAQAAEALKLLALLSGPQEQRLATLVAVPSLAAQMAASDSPAAAAAAAAMADEAVVVAEQYRGIASASASVPASTQAWTAAVCGRALPPLVQLLRACLPLHARAVAHEAAAGAALVSAAEFRGSAAVTAILKMLRDFVEAQAPRLHGIAASSYGSTRAVSDASTAFGLGALVAACREVVAAYADAAPRLRLAADATLEDDDERHLRLLMSTMMFLVQDCEPPPPLLRRAPTAASSDAAALGCVQLVLAATHLLLPLAMQPAAASASPALRRALAGLLLVLCERSILGQHLVAGSSELVVPLLAAIQEGVAHPLADVAGASLRCAFALAKAHALAVAAACRGGRGRSSGSLSANDPSVGLNRHLAAKPDALGQLLAAVLDVVMHGPGGAGGGDAGGGGAGGDGDDDAAVVGGGAAAAEEAAANALLALAVCDSARCTALVQQRIAAVADPATRARIASGLTTMMTGSGVLVTARGLKMRGNRQQFRRNVEAFAVQCRGFLSAK